MATNEKNGNNRGSFTNSSRVFGWIFVPHKFPEEKMEISKHLFYKLYVNVLMALRVERKTVYSITCGYV